MPLAVQMGVVARLDCCHRGSSIWHGRSVIASFLGLVGVCEMSTVWARIVQHLAG